MEGSERGKGGESIVTQAELQVKINNMKAKIIAESAKNKGEEQFQELLLAGLDIVGELFMDIKRISEGNSG